MSAAPHRRGPVQPISALAGIGLRAAHEQQVLDESPAIGWLEVHSENYFAPGGRPQMQLQRIAERYPLSLHGIGLGLGNSAPLDREHLRALDRLVRLVDPVAVSEHLCWNGHGGRFVPDLLPLPRTFAVVQHVASRIDTVQQILGRSLLIENVSSYVEFEGAQMCEWEFLLEVADRSGCDLLLDVNNVYVNACNHGFDARGYLDAIPAQRVGEIHLAGHSRREIDGQPLLVDTHDRPVSAEVWALYETLIARIGPRPTLIERDARLPPLAELLAEADVAAEIMRDKTAVAAAQ